MLSLDGNLSLGKRTVNLLLQEFVCLFVSRWKVMKALNACKFSGPCVIPSLCSRTRLNTFAECHSAPVLNTGEESLWRLSVNHVVSEANLSVKNLCIINPVSLKRKGWILYRNAMVYVPILQHNQCRLFQSEQSHFLESFPLYLLTTPGNVL